MLRPAPDLAVYPLLLNATEGVHAQACTYFRDQIDFGDKAASSLTDEAYILADWFNHLLASGLGWERPSARVFVAWSRAGKPSGQRRRRRAHVVFAFYEFVDRVYRSEAGAEIHEFIRELTAPISDRDLERDQPVRRTLRLRVSTRDDVRRMRPTPTEEQVDAIAEVALKDAQPLQARDWLLIRTAFETNLRCQGLAQLSTDHLVTMLAREGIVDRKANLLAMAKYQDQRTQVRSEIDTFEATGRTVFISEVREKGKTRQVQFPIQVVRQILDYVWEDRVALVKRLQGLDTRALWVSRKTGRALKSGSIGDIMKSAFVAARVDGSGHRLRAAHCVRLFRTLIEEAERNGAGKFDALAILERVAQLMGHQSPETLRPYLNLVLLERRAIAQG